MQVFGSRVIHNTIFNLPVGYLQKRNTRFSKSNTGTDGTLYVDIFCTRSYS